MESQRAHGAGGAAPRAGLRSVPVSRRSLPRGPHALPQDVVLEHQRERLLRSAAEAIAESGYCELTVRDVIAGAGVSRRTFYELFDDKLDCILAAHELSLGRLEKALRAACRTAQTWPDGVAAAVAAGLDFAERRPAEARLVLFASHTVSDPGLMDAARAGHEKLAALLSEGRTLAGDERDPLDLTEEALVGAITAIVGARLCEGERDLQSLAPQLVQMILAPYVGRGEAQRVARAA